MKSVVCVFAHPDDEAMGPGGTIAKLATSNNVYIICATAGEAGTWKNTTKDKIADVRRSELLASAQILGVKEVRFLGFKDGELSNSKYPHLAKKIKQHLDELKPETVITFEIKGISGHIDHIVVASVTSFIVQKLSYVKKVLYYCLTARMRKAIGDYFVYFPPGYEDRDIDETVDVSEVWDKKLAAIRCHRSQQDDVDEIISLLETVPRKEHFLTRVK